MNVNRTAVVEELVKGRELTRQIGTLLKEKTTCKELVEEVMSSFSRAIMALDEKRQSYNDDGIEKRGHSAQSRGYKRRSHQCSWTRTKSKTLDDGHSWRKYGQKVINSAKFPRSYFRCSHKFDQDCPAMRQVQRSEENPSLFLITYFGEHTCRGMSEVLSSCIQEDTNCMIDFSSVNKESYEETVGNINNIPTTGCSSSENFELPELGTLIGCSTDNLVSEFMGLHSSPENLNWDFIEQSFEFNDMYGLI